MADSTLRVAINADIRGLNANLNKAQTRLKAFSGRLKNIGGQLQTRLALPLIAAGGASIKMAADFDKSMTKIKTLVGVAGADVDAMTAGVKEMANATGVSSGEAADALFFITSAGLRGADAMAVLEAATKASALGLGDTATVADLATSALNAYGIENLSATGATDVLTAAVREGKLEASELSSVMGQVLPVASNMGVQFHEVGAAFAAMSRTGTPAAQAATQLNSILMAIMKPTKQSAEAMEQLGLSSQGLRQQIKDEGLLSVFQTLKTASEGNSEAFEQVFGNVRALKGILDLTGASAATTAEIFNRMANTSGVTAQAFEVLQTSASFKLTQGLTTLKNSFANLGGTLMQTFLPMIQNVIGFVQNLFTAFNNLDPVTKQLSLGFAAFAAVLPTLLTIGGSLLGVFAAMVSPIGLIAAGVAAVAFAIYKNWNEILPVVVGLYNRFVDLYNSSETLQIAAALIKTAFQAAFIRIQEAISQVVNTFKTMWSLIKKVAGQETRSFEQIMSDSFDNAKLISEKAGEEIGSAFTENMLQAMKPMEHKTVQQVKTSMTNVANQTKGYLRSAFSGIGVAATGGAATSAATTATPSGQPTEVTPVKVDEDTKVQAEEDMLDLSSTFTSGFENIIGSVAAGNAGMGAVFGGLLGMLGDVAKQIGRAAIGIGISMEAIKKAFANPVTAIAAGVALLALGAVIKNFGNKFGGGGGGVAKFANGGIVSGPTLGLMGEYSGARSNPEVIAPLDKLKGMIAQTGGQNVNVGGEFRIQGQDLVVALQRAERNRKRII
jgi:TP901 family phage tail tape measure protein